MDQKRKLEIRRQQARLRQQQRLQQQKAKVAPPPVPANKPIQRKPPRSRPSQHVPHPLEKPKDIDPLAYNNECFIVGGGPSLVGFDWTNLDGKFVIAINRAYEVLPDAQIVYFTDDDYWQRHQKAMLQHKGKKFRGRIHRRKVIMEKDVVELQLQPTPAGWSDTFGELYHGSNSSYACIQLAAQLGFTTIYLLGVDMKHQGKFDRKANNSKGNNKGVTHWHSGHRRTDPPTAYKMMMGHYAKLAPEAAKRNIKVISVNTEDGTDLKCFPIKSFQEVFGVDHLG